MSRELCVESERGKKGGEEEDVEHETEQSKTH